MWLKKEQTQKSESSGRPRQSRSNTPDAEAIPNVDDDIEYPTGLRLAFVKISLVFGKLHSFSNIKATYIAANVLFEFGSAFAIIAHPLPLHKRPAFQGLFGAIFGVSSIIGPLVGGAFTTNVTWRWCFYINLSIGGAASVVIAFPLQIPQASKTSSSLVEKFRKSNPLGLLALVPRVVCLCLAMQWGGTVYAWGIGRAIATLTLGLLLLIIFVGLQIWRGDEAILPPRTTSQRSIAAAFCLSRCLGAHQLIFLYYLPIWFQAVEGTSAVGSGIRLLEMVIPVVIASVVTGKLISSTGYYTPFAIAGACLTAIAAGLITTSDVNTSTGMWIGYQIVYGSCFGLCGQTPDMAAPTVLARQEVAIDASFMLFGQQLFGTIFTSIGQNVLYNQLADLLAAFTNISPASIPSTGVTDIFNSIADRFRS
ncbi:major facilitator superfamily domain-containing [Lecanosticta acicola]|uniref:Major facilitator superfamily domain-containing n=1 Tax=Lecanosticta acicola TaxID=111012 RepID=A0AAI8YRS6_9PEZI|nr:major facilitator superfamily domain-containing [Lecanosticta acicola]